ncbi:pyridoxamine 5'-phosphate oxidase family protein [Nocardia sp. NPDC004168]|uniref:pyridoxamine 5'-phosphate oxidase family protein n=1 Tax=Nocardia TaxID=1817 RepID=UPI0033BD043B
MVRALRDAEITELLDADVVARLATIDPDGYPHVTPIWFFWVAGAFYLTSYANRPHLERIRANPRVGLVIDVEDELRADGERPNRQVRVIGDATLSVDASGSWTQRIRRKYVDHTIAPAAARRYPVRERVLITVLPRDITAVASV